MINVSYIVQLDITDPYIYCMNPLEVEESSQDGAIKPNIGMEFRTSEEAYTHYNNYACRVGFGVRIGGNGKNKHGLSNIRFVCNKEGFTKLKKKWKCR